VPLQYPDARVENAEDCLAGVSFPDPYRWLEGNTDEVRQWQEAQAALASAHVRQWPHFPALSALVKVLNAERRATLPHYAAGRWFSMSYPKGASQAQAIVAKTPLGPGRVLFDPAAENPKAPPFLSWISPAPDGKTLALGVCVDGSENNTIRLIDVASGDSILDPPGQTLMDNWIGGVQWLPDSSGFFFSALTGEKTAFRQRFFFCHFSPEPSTALLSLDIETSDEYRALVISTDERHALVFERLQNPIPIAVAAIRRGQPLSWRRFVTDFNGTLAGHAVGERFVAVTDLGAPRGRVVTIDLEAEAPNDSGAWREIVPESQAVIRTVTPVGKAIYLTEFVDAYARIRIVDFKGRELDRLSLPDRGAVSEFPFPLMNLIPRRHDDRFLFAFSSFRQSWGIYSHRPGSVEIETLQEPKIRLKNVVVEDCSATSRDGTRIPFRAVRNQAIDSSRPQPTLISAYGGFNVPWTPQFPGAMAAFVVMGGVFVHAHLRGGGEFGLDWWEAGRLRNKQNSYDDLYAVARHLIDSGRSTSRQLAVTGSSNGGLMAGVAVTQRPELWAVAVPRAPRLDLIGACRSAYGRLSTMSDRTADLNDPEEARRLTTFSPYHLVRNGIAYPAVYIDAGSTDPRCPPQDARKFGARLQRATVGMAPILLHIWHNVGHGWATDKNVEAEQLTHWLAFVMRHLHFEPKVLDPSLLAIHKRARSRPPRSVV